MEGRSLGELDAVRYRDILPIRASAYILSLVNEQVERAR